MAGNRLDSALSLHKYIQTIFIYTQTRPVTVAILTRIFPLKLFKFCRPSLGSKFTRRAWYLFV